MRMWLKPDVLARLGLTVTDVQNALRQQNVVNPAGQIGAEPAPPGQQLTYTVRAQGRLVEPEEFGNVVVRENPDGSSVRVTRRRAHRARRAQLPAVRHLQRPARRGHRGVPDAGLERARRRRATSARRWTTSPSASRRASQYKVSLDTTAPVNAGIREIVETLARGHRARRARRLRVPAELARHADPAADRAGVAGRRVRDVSAARASRSTRSRSSASCSPSVSSSTTPSSWSRRSSTTSRRVWRRATRPSARCPRCRGPVVAIALDSGGGVHPGRVHGRHHRAPLPAVRAHHRHLGAHLGVQRAHAEPRARARCSCARAATQRGLLGRLGDRLQPLVRHERPTATSRSTAASIRKIAIPLVLLGGVAGAAGLVGSKLPSGFVPDEDQGYADHRRAAARTARRCSERARSTPRSTRSSRSSRAFATTTASPASASSRAPRRATPAPASSASSRGTSARRPRLTSGAILASLNAAVLAHPRGARLRRRAARHPRHQRAGGFSMMLQDKQRQSVRVPRAERRQASWPRRRKRPELAGVRPNFSPAVPQLFADVDKDKALKEGVPLTEIYNALQTFLGGSYINDFTRFGRQWRVFLQAESAFRTSPDDIGKFYVRNAARRHGAAVVVRHASGRRRGRSTRCASTFTASVEIQGIQAPGYSSGQALDALEDVAKKTLPAGHGLRVERPVVPGEGGLGRRSEGARACRSCSCSSSSRRSTRAGRCPSASF